MLLAFSLISAFVSSLSTPIHPKKAIAVYEEPAAGMKFVHIPAGSFLMGSPEGESKRGRDELEHRVTITKDFWIGQFEVTQAEWTKILGRNPSYHKGCGEKCPVESVTWLEIQNFLSALTARSDGSRYRLPSEAEWEYVCRAGTATPFQTGAILDIKQARFDASDGPVAVGSYRPNSWGVFDMHGNVWEWTKDWYGSYDVTRAVDPAGPGVGDKKVIRGGSWYFGADSARCALRYTHSPGDRGFSLGFRVVREATPVAACDSPILIDGKISAKQNREKV
jgi:formylglycine-generating enzyme required for sulfatase activity